jgi:hypothetical protein
MFREGTNKKGLAFFISIIVLLIFYLAWQSGNVVVEEDEIIIEPEKNYHVVIEFNNSIYELWRYDNLLKFQQSDQIQLYYNIDLNSLRMYNKDRLISPNSNFSDFMLKYDPWNIISTIKGSLVYIEDDLINSYEVELYGEGASVFINTDYLPDSIVLHSSKSSLQYNYLDIGNVSMEDVQPIEINNED